MDDPAQRDSARLADEAVVLYRGKIIVEILPPGWKRTAIATGLLAGKGVRR